MSFVCRSSAARATLRPMRPKPLMPTLTISGSLRENTVLSAESDTHRSALIAQHSLVYPPPMSVEPIRWLGDRLQLLDQRRLPREVVWVDCRSASDVATAIRDMVVRGAPAI